MSVARLVSLVVCLPLVGRADLRLDVTASPTSIVIGQRITLTYRLSNSGPTAVTGDLCLDHACGLLVVMISSGEKSNSYMPRSRILGRSLERVRIERTLEVGETIETTACLLYDERAGNLALSEAGDYQVHVKFTGPSGELTAKAAAIHVDSPTGDALSAFETMRRDHLEPYLCDEAAYYELAENTRAALVTFAKDFSQTPYASGTEEGLTALGIRARLELRPDVVHFGSAPMAGVVPGSVRVTNGGGEPLQLTALGGLSSPFRTVELPPLPATLDPQTSLDVQIEFAPRKVQPFRGELIVQSSAGSGTVTLDGEGSAAPAIGLSSVFVDFGRMPIGSTATEHIDVTNLGSEDLVVSNVGPLHAPFHYGLLETLPWTIPTGQSKTIAVTFVAERGVFDGLVAITSNDPWSPEARARLRAEAAAVQDGCGCGLGSGSMGKPSWFWLVALFVVRFKLGRHARHKALSKCNGQKR